MNQEIDLLMHGRTYKKLYEKTYQKIRKEYNLRKVDIEILDYLYNCGSNNTPKDITVLMNFNKGHVSQSIDRMLKLQLIHSVQDEIDKRCIHIILTAKALEIIHEIIEIRRKMYETLFEGVTKEELQIFIQVSEKLNYNMIKALN